MKKILLAFAVLGVLASAGSAGSTSTTWSFVGTNLIASSPVAGGGYPVPPGSTKPLPGTCGPQMLNSNHSESWLAVKPGTEDGRGFIGDYFGLAISNSNIYTLSVSTHYPGEDVTADGGGPVYYQQQVLGKVPRSTFGVGF